MPNVKATNTLRKRSDAAVESFHRHYAQIWGDERWNTSLFPALCQPTRYCALMNRFSDFSEKSTILRNDGADEIVQEVSLDALGDAIEEKQVSRLLEVVTRSSDRPFVHPKYVGSANSQKALLSHWLMDFASVLAAFSLRVQPGDRVLDLCAAPGGKSVVLSQLLFPEFHVNFSPSGETSTADTVRSVLHSNEFDKERHKRLESNLHTYLPDLLFADHAVKTVRTNGTTTTAVSDLPLGEEGYDKVIVDAPCSSERHLIHAYLTAASAGQVSEEMTNWKSSHTKALAKTQIALLMTALHAAKIGGRVLYATCSISTEENDDVIDRVFEAVRRRQKKDANHLWRVQVDTTFEDNVGAAEVFDKLTEKTKHGRIALPDHPSGARWGPLYICLLRKVQRKLKSMQTIT